MSDSEKKNITVEIYGKQYMLASQQNSEYVEQVAQKVDSLMKEIGGGSLNDLNCSILASMTLADELEKKEQELIKLREEIEEQQEMMNIIGQKLDSELEID